MQQDFAVEQQLQLLLTHASGGGVCAAIQHALNSAVDKLQSCKESAQADHLHVMLLITAQPRMLSQSFAVSNLKAKMLSCAMSHVMSHVRRLEF